MGPEYGARIGEEEGEANTCSRDQTSKNVCGINEVKITMRIANQSRMSLYALMAWTMNDIYVEVMCYVYPIVEIYAL